MLTRVIRIVVLAFILAGTLVGSLQAMPASASTQEDQVIAIVNRIRAQNGLGPVSYNPTLATAARRYAGYMASANFFSHSGPDGSTMTSRIEAAGYRPWTFVAENLGAGQSSPEQVVDGWMNSPGHRANILSPKVREIGVGYAYQAGSRYGHYWAQEFGSRPAVAAAAPAPAPAPARVEQVQVVARAPEGWTAPQTGKTVSGPWLRYLREHGDVSNMGLPRSSVIADPTNGGQTVQFFQRAIVEFHPENPAGAQYQRRLLADILYPGADAPISSADAPSGPSTYFPFSPDRPTGLGHFVADYTRSGQPVYFKQYFDRHGGVGAFGFPKEEPKLRDGLWTQRFQAAVFEYHPEFDRDGLNPDGVPWRNFRVQLALLGDQYLSQRGLNPN